MKTETLPQAIEAEESILASCFFGHAEQVAEILKPEDFYSIRHQKIFEAVVTLTKKGVVADLPALTMELQESGKLEEIGGASFLAGILDQVPAATNIEYFSEKIKEKSAKRELIQTFQNAIQTAMTNTTTDTAAIINDLKGRLHSINEGIGGAGRERAVSYQTLCNESGDRYEDLYKRGGAITGIATGFYALDGLLGGLQRGDLVIVAARPSMGKTAAALNIAGHVAKNGGKVAFFSLEMGRNQLFDRQIAGESGINLQKFRTGRFDAEDWQRVVDAQSKIYDWPVFIDDTAALHHQEIRRRAWDLKNRHDVDLVVIDHLQLVRGDREPTRDREIGAITAACKALAKDLNIPVILLSQLNRQLEARANPEKRPRLSDLRDSGNIEQDADVILFLYRPAVYKDAEDYPGHAEFIIAKHRNGPTGLIKMLWNDRTTRFLNRAG